MNIARIGLITLLASLTGLACADDKVAGSDTNNDWYFALGLGALSQPEYPGSSKQQIQPWPLYKLNYKQRFFFDNFNGLGLNIIHTEHWNLGNSIVYVPSNKYGKEYPGIQSSPYTFEHEIFVNYRWNRYQVEVSTNRTMGHLNGSGYYTPAFIVNFDLSRRFKVLFRTAAQYDDAEYMQAHYGVSSSESTASGIRTYNVAHGWDNVNASAITMFGLNQRWSLLGAVRATHYVSQVAESPLVKNRNTYALGVGAMYRFI